ncbi:MAG: phosphoribosyltransferase family protein [Nanoarchaeota archaeon]
MNGVASVNQRLLAIECLRTLKGSMTFRELSKEVKLPAGVLNRYVNGNVLPKLSRANEILHYFEKQYFRQYLLKESFAKESKFLVTTTILSKPFYLRFIASHAAHYFPEKVDKVFTAAVDGIPLAVAIADYLGAEAIYAKQTQEFTFSGHYVSKLPVSERPLETPFFLPKDLIKKNEKILICDDVIRGGRTLQALISICKQAKADVVGVYSIFMGKKALKSLDDYKVGYMMTVGD